MNLYIDIQLNIVIDFKVILQLIKYLHYYLTQKKQASQSACLFFVLTKSKFNIKVYPTKHDRLHQQDLYQSLVPLPLLRTLLFCW